MFESLLEKFIINYLGRYFSGFDKKKIDIGIWKGDISIENIALNHDLFISNNLPIEVVFSQVARIALKVPWTKLSSSSVELIIEDMFLLVRIKSKEEWKFQDFNTLEGKFAILKKYAEKVAEKLVSMETKPDPKAGTRGNMEKLLIKIIDNLQIVIKNIHIRIESTEDPNFAAGVHLANLKVNTVDESFGNQIYQKLQSKSTERVVRKLAKISSFQVYWASKPKDLWLKNPDAEVLFLKFKTFTLGDIDTYKIISLTADLRLTINEKGGSYFNYFNKAYSNYIVEIDIPQLDIKLTSSQIKDLLNLLANLDNFKSKMALSLESIHHGIFRPAERIKDAKLQEKSLIIGKWWRYAVKASFLNEKTSLGGLSKYWGGNSQEKFHEHTFKALFLMIYNKKLSLQALSKNELLLFEEIVKGYSIGSLKNWAEFIVIKESAGKSQQNSKNKASEEDIFHLRHFLQNNTEDDFKETEIKSLEKAILKSISSDSTDLVNKQIQLIRRNTSHTPNENFVKYQFQIKLRNGSVYLNNDTQEARSNTSIDNQEKKDKGVPIGPSYKLAYEGMETEFNLGTEKMDLTYKLETLSLSATLRGSDLSIASVNKKKGNEPFLLFYMDQPIRRNAMPVTVHLGIGSIHFIYYPFVIYEFQNLLTLDNFEEKGKNIAMRELRSIGERSKTKVEEYMQSPPEIVLDIFIESPIVTIPFPLWRETDGTDRVSEMLVLNLGDLRISNHEDSRAVVEKEMQKFAKISPYYASTIKSNNEFEEINISLSSINLVYYPNSFECPVAMLYSMNDVNFGMGKGSRRESADFQENFTIIENFSLNVNISKLKQKFLAGKNPEVKVSGKIYDLSINLSAKVYELLTVLAQRENDSRAKGFFREQKARIVNKATLKGYLNHQTTSTKGWKRYYILISGPYLYFYESESALKPKFYVSINSSNVKESGKQKNSFMVINVTGKHTFLCNDKDHMAKWMNEIKKKSIEFSPAFEGTFHEKTVQSKLPKMLAVVSLQIDRLKVTLKNQINKDWMTLLLTNIYFLVQDTEHELNIRLKLESIDFFEPKINTVNHSLKSFIKSNPREDNTASHLIDVHVITKKEKSTEERNVDTLVNFKFGNLTINWKPKLILELQGFFKKPPASTGSLESNKQPSVPEQQGEFSTFSMAWGQFDEEEEVEIPEDTISLIMSFSAERIVIYLESSDLYLASLHLIDYQMNIRVKPDQLDIQGSLSQVKIYDLTRYPHTCFKKEDFYMLHPEEIFSTNKNESAVKFSFLDFSKDSKINNLNKRKKLLNLDFSSFNLIYFQQPTLRLINYFLDSIMGILIQESPYRTFSEAIRTLDLPSFTEMRVTINRPKIRLKPHPAFKYYYDIDLGYIVLTNTHEKSSKRVIRSTVDEVWIEKYLIRFSNMVLLANHGDKTQRVSEYFNLQMEVERMIFNTEYNTVYKTSKFDKGIHITGHFTPVIICLNKLNYLLLLSLIFSNITLDDRRESFFFQNFKTGNQTSTTIKIELDFDSVDILLLDEDNWPILSLGIIHKFISITRDANKEITLNMKGDRLFGNFYITNPIKGIVHEHAYVSIMAFTKDYPIQRIYIGGDDGKKVIDIWRAYSEIFENIKNLSKSRVTSNNQELDINKFSLIMQLKNNSEKNIQIEFEKLKLLLNLKLTRFASDFFGYSEKVQIFAPSIDLSQRKYIPQLNIEIKFTDCLVLLSGKADIHTIALKGKFSFMYVRNSYEESELYTRNPIRKEIEEEKEIVMKKKESASEDLDDNNEIDQKTTSKWIFDAHQMEIIMGALEDLIQLPHVRSNVKNIFLPFNIFITSENSILNELLNKQTNTRAYLSRNLKRFNFEMANIRVTYKDFMNLIKIFQYQLENYNDYSDTINSLKNDKVFPKSSTKTLKDSSFQETSYQQTIYGLQGIHFVLINDVFGAHSPLLDFNIKNSEIVVLKSGKTSLTSSLSLSVNFFNPFIGRWEPIVEPLTFYLDSYKTEPPSANTFITIESGQVQSYNPVHINISQEMVTIVKRDLKLCMEEYKRLSKFEELETIEENDEENIVVRKLPASEYNKNNTSPEKRPNFFGYSTVVHKMSYMGTDFDIYSPYGVLNHIGQSCYVEPVFDEEDNNPSSPRQTYHCISGRVCDIYLENKTDFSHLGNEFRQISQKIEIEIPLKLNYSFLINDIELNQVSQKKYYLTYQNPTSQKEENYELLSYVELVGTKRILTLSSVNKIVNCTVENLIFRIIHDDQTQDEVLSKGAEFYIPFTFNNFKLSFQLDNSQGWKTFVTYEQLMRSDVILQFRLENKHFVIRKEASIKNMNVFVIEPPFILRNFLPLSVHFDLYDLNNPNTDNINPQVVTTLDEGEAVHLYDFKWDCQLATKLRIENLMVSEVILLLCKNKSSDRIILKDFDKKICIINLYIVGERNGCKTLYFYTDLFIRNQTPYNLLFEYKYDGDLIKFARQEEKVEKMRSKTNSKIILAQTDHRYQRIYISLKDDPSIRTKKISLQSIGGNSVTAQNKEMFLRSSGTSEAEGKLACYEFGVEINMINHLKPKDNEINHFIFSKVVTISPRYVVVNKTKYPLSIIQPKAMYSTPFIVDPNKRIPFYWKNSKLKRQIKILLEDSHKAKNLEWKWSGSLELSTIGNQHFMCVKANGNEVRFLRATTIIEKSVLYTVIEEQNDPNQLGYRIINDFHDCSIFFHQNHSILEKEKRMHIFQIVGSQQKGFSWQKPLLKKEIKFIVRFKNPHYDILIMKCQPDKINTVESYTIRSHGRPTNMKVTMKVFMDGNTRVMKFSPFTRQEEETPKTEVEKFSLTLNIGIVGVSIISTIDNIRKEVIFIGVKGFEFMWLESSENRTFHMRVKHLQIDNNSSFHAQYPVLLTPHSKMFTDKNDDKYFLDGLVTISLKDKKSLILPQVKFEISKPVIRIEDYFIEIILKVIKSFQTDMTHTMESYKLKSTHKHIVTSPPRHFLRSSIGTLVEFDWNQFDIETNSKSIYVEDFGLSFVEIIFSFRMNYDTFEKKEFSVTKLVSNALGVALTNIEDAPIKLQGLEITDVLDSPSRFIEKLGKHYKQELIKSVFYLIGSVEILGNPIGLFNHITTGMIDFIEKPREGFIQGPLEGGMGIVKGTHSLFRNTIVGTFGTVNKITGSVAAGISTLSLDQEFIKRREGLRKKRANDVVDGLGQGLYALYDGFNQGVVGLFTKPYEEASRSGFTGLLKGTYMGISGVFVKPVIGILDAASKTAEGFKNMAEIHDQALLSVKERIPRPFYGKLMMFKSYIPYDAEMILLLSETSEAEINRYSYIDAYPMRSSKEISYILNLVIFLEAVGLYSLKLNKFVWLAEYEWIDKVEQFGIFITFNFNRELPKTTITTYTIPNANNKMNDLILEQIKNLMKKKDLK